MTELERAKLTLIDEFEMMPHTRKDLLGNAACARKIKDLIMSFVKENAEESTCKDEMKSLMIESGVSEENFEKEIIPEINVYYKAKELIDKGYYND